MHLLLHNATESKRENIINILHIRHRSKCHCDSSTVVKPLPPSSHSIAWAIEFEMRNSDRRRLKERKTWPASNAEVGIVDMWAKIRSLNLKRKENSHQTATWIANGGEYQHRYGSSKCSRRTRYGQLMCEIWSQRRGHSIASIVATHSRTASRNRLCR